jgi:1,4-alpha-glucan branching enzyme
MAEPRVLEKRPKSPAKRVSFVARAEKAKSVSVTGDFTGWAAEGIPLSKGSNGDWLTSLVLPPGEYQYRLRVDGQWQDHAQAQQRVRNSFGSENCVLTVEG